MYNEDFMGINICNGSIKVLCESIVLSVITLTLPKKGQQLTTFSQTSDDNRDRISSSQQLSPHIPHVLPSETALEVTRSHALHL